MTTIRTFYSHIRLKLPADNSFKVLKKFEILGKSSHAKNACELIAGK